MSINTQDKTQKEVKCSDKPGADVGVMTVNATFVTDFEDHAFSEEDNPFMTI